MWKKKFTVVNFFFSNLTCKESLFNNLFFISFWSSNLHLIFNHTLHSHSWNLHSLSWFTLLFFTKKNTQTYQSNFSFSPLKTALTLMLQSSFFTEKIKQTYTLCHITFHQKSYLTYNPGIVSNLSHSNQTYTLSEITFHQKSKLTYKSSEFLFKFACLHRCFFK